MTIRLAIIAVILGFATLAQGQGWKPAPDTLLTRWATDVSPDQPWPEYPRPQLVREEWQNLNGLWDYAIRPKGARSPGKFDGRILVPYAIESALSGVKKTVGPENRLWYRREFSVPEAWSGRRVLLHFEAVDWETRVWVNGRELGVHRGGYDPFTFDITEALTPTGVQQVVLAVWDPTDTGFQPRGKQVLKPGGIMYTAVTGIWQTVWLEPVNEVAITALKMTPNVREGSLDLTVKATGKAVVHAEATRDGVVVASAKGGTGGKMTLTIPRAEAWSPDHPFLYGLKIRLVRRNQTLDEATSYFGLREINVREDDRGYNRLFLNGKPLFQFGLLDQGWWPDGLYTAPTDAALAFDVEITRQMGFNMARKHVKMEPRRWYYHCDRLGLLVWQDMVSGDGGVRPGAKKDFDRSPESARQYEREFAAMMDTLQGHPSIVMWVVFNEGWGQFDTNRITDWVKEYDPTRLVDQASGWQDRKGGDVHDMHRYPGPAMPDPEPDRAVVLGEFGGLGLPVSGHLWRKEGNFGYRNLEAVDVLRTEYATLLTALRTLIGRGLAAAVYTQTTDVEGEVNGLLTYDRDMVKMGAAWLAEQNAKVFRPAPKVTVILPTSEVHGQTWRYTTDTPPDGWEKPGFEDRAWKEGVGVFGTKGTPGAVVRTLWDTPEIWIRRTVKLEAADLANLVLNLLHDEDAEVYVNGILAADTKGYTTSYQLVEMLPGATSAFGEGRNTLAVHCRQTRGGQSIDLGLVKFEEQK